MAALTNQTIPIHFVAKPETNVPYDSTTTIADLKQKVCDAVGDLSLNMNLVQNGKILENVSLVTSVLDASSSAVYAVFLTGPN